MNYEMHCQDQQDKVGGLGKNSKGYLKLPQLCRSLVLVRFLQTDPLRSE